MQKRISLTMTAFALAFSLSACGGGPNTSAAEPLNVTGNWSGSLQTTSGGGLGSLNATLTQAASPATTFTGTLSLPLYGGSSPIVGDAAQGTLATDTSNPTVNTTYALSCTGTFTNSSYKGNCQMQGQNGSFVLVLTKQ